MVERRDREKPITEATKIRRQMELLTMHSHHLPNNSMEIPESKKVHVLNLNTVFIWSITTQVSENNKRHILPKTKTNMSWDWECGSFLIAHIREKRRIARLPRQKMISDTSCGRQPGMKHTTNRSKRYGIITLILILLLNKGSIMGGNKRNAVIQKWPWWRNVGKKEWNGPELKPISFSK